MEVTLRRCVPGDEAALALVGQATFLETFAGILPGSDIVAHCTKQHALAKYSAWLEDSGSALWVAEAKPGDASVGYVLLTKPDLPLPDLGPDDVEIKRIYLLRRFQGSGVGARMMQEAETRARQMGHRRVLLGVYGQNTSAIGFYERLGYKRVGTRDFTVGANTYFDYIFARSLI